MSDWFVWIAEQDRRREAIEQAADRHYSHDMVRESSLRERRPIRRHERFLLALGKRLVYWGCRLHVRYQQPTENCRILHVTVSIVKERDEPTACA